MKGKTKIVVLRMREILKVLIFVCAGIMAISALFLFFSGKDRDAALSLPDPAATQTEETENSLYIPGTYSTELVLGNESVTLSVTVAGNSIISVELGQQSEAVTTLYPLLEPTLSAINEQISQNGSLENVTGSTENRYTSMVLLQAIQSSLEQAKN